MGLGIGGRRWPRTLRPQELSCPSPMKLLAFLTETFIATFGITRPRPEQERLVNLLIGGFLLVFGTGLLLVMGFLVYQVSASGHIR